jgi:hypothetical protein
MGMYSGLSATELDSHANMAVAGSETTVIARSGMFANVTPFSKDLPAMDMVEIGDVAMCYDDPISLITYILVMKNVLLIPSMGHNLIPPFLIREAGLLLDENPKHQTPYPTIDNHSIRDQRSGLRIHLQLNGIFSYFKTWPLTLEEQENWENYQVVMSLRMVTLGIHILSTLRMQKQQWWMSMDCLLNEILVHSLTSSLKQTSASSMASQLPGNVMMTL